MNDIPTSSSGSLLQAELQHPVDLIALKGLYWQDDLLPPESCHA